MRQLSRFVSTCVLSSVFLHGCASDGGGTQDGDLGTHAAAVSVPAQIFAVVADARVESGAPTTNRGTSPFLRAETTGTTGAVWSYMKFDVSGLTSTVQSARLRVFVSDGTDNGPKVYKASTNSWDQLTITWNNKPGLGGTIGEDPMKVPSGDYVEWDVTSLVSGNGTYSFAFVPDSADRMNGRSKEDSNPPQLVIHTAPSKLTFGAAADARVNSEYPEVEYGSDYLWVRPADAANGWPDVRTYLKFNVSGVTTPVTNARVRLYNYDWASNGPRIYHVTNDTWTEATINWNNRPAADVSLLDDKGAVPSNTYTEWDVSDVVTGDGTYSFVLVGDPTSHSMRAYSKENATLRPELVVLAGGTAPPPVPPASGARWPISNSTAPDMDTLEDAYGPRLNSGELDFHAGVDIEAITGTDVHAVLDGTVADVVDNLDPNTPCCSGGNKVIIRHPGTPNRYSSYLHLSQVFVAKDQAVVAGQVIGKVGKSGAIHEHLHFTYSETQWGESYSKNPLKLLPHTAPPAPIVTFNGAVVSIVLPVQKMTVHKIKLEGSGLSRSIDYSTIVARGNPDRNLTIQGDGMHLWVPANPAGTPKTFTLEVDANGAFVPTKITLESFDGQVWEFYGSSTPSSWSDVITADQYYAKFPRTGIWTYESFIAAAENPAFAGFGTTGDLTTRRREVAAFLANVAHEADYFGDPEESAPPSQYCLPNPSWYPECGCPATTAGYGGRGPLHLSWNYNYCAASEFLYGDNDFRLLNDPHQVASTASIGWNAALWFWMESTGSSYGTPYEMTSHTAMTTSAGFWATVNALNGGQECDFGEDVSPDYIESRNQRKRYFDDFVLTLATDNGSPSQTYCP